jgi:DNA repair exonuclease SbcCD nuclease subunit
MKVAIITDQHFGARNDSIQLLDFYEKFYAETFFPKLKETKVDAVLILGDTFDRRKFINFYSLKRAKQMFFAPLMDLGIEVHMLAGNHDTYFKNTNDVNSVDLLLSEYGNTINVIDSPSEIYVGPHKICMMPWICAENYQQSMDMIKDTTAEICCGHFEIAGFAMYRGMTSEEGLEKSLFRKFDFTFSGHYHHKSNSDSIYYLGNPYELTWQDYNDPRGFHIFDLEKRELEFIQNPNNIFHRISYDDKDQSFDQITNKDLSGYKDTYVKVIVVNKTNPYLFDQFLEKLNLADPIDVTIVEDFTMADEEDDDSIVDQAEDTLTILNKYVDSIKQESINVSKLKNVMKDLYVEAVNREKV